MKIVRIIARLNVGGPARHTVWLTKELQDGDFQSILVTGTVSEGEEDMSYFAAERGVNPIFIPGMKRELSPADIFTFWKVFQLLRSEKPDIIHSHTGKAGTVGRVAGFFYRWLTPQTLVGRPRRVSFVHTYHGHFFHSYYGNLKTKIFLFIEKTLARLATDRIVVISNQQYAEIHEQFGVGKSKQFRVIPLGIDLTPFENHLEKRNFLREELGIKPNEILVGLIGRLTEIKNHEFFLRIIKIYKECRATDFPPIRFVIIGDGNLRDKLENEAENLGIKDIVEFLGNRTDAEIFYAGLDIVALSSLNEGTPLSLIEAMANSRPVISTAVGGVVDLLGEVSEKKEKFTVCERGVRVASNDAEGFFEGLLYLAKNEKLRGEMGLRGRKFVVANYSKERLVTDIRNLYWDLSKEKG
ncbi:MAG: glycosyltransferase [Pyrinomonadaceae bacterium]